MQQFTNVQNQKQQDLQQPPNYFQVQKQNQQDVQQPPNHLKKIFIVQAVLGALCCYSRADYNLPLFAFAYLLWDYDITQKVRLIFLFIFTWLIDFIWICYWGSVWDSNTQQTDYYARGVDTFVLVISIINFLIKLISIIYAWWLEHELKDVLTLDGIKSSASELVKSHQ